MDVNWMLIGCQLDAYQHPARFPIQSVSPPGAGCVVEGAPGVGAECPTTSPREEPRSLAKEQRHACGKTRVRLKARSIM